MTSLSPESRSIIDAARPAEDLDDGSRGRMKRQLMMNVAAGAAAAGATAAATKAAAGTAATAGTAGTLEAAAGLGSMSLLTKIGLSVTIAAALGVGTTAIVTSENKPDLSEYRQPAASAAPAEQAPQRTGPEASPTPAAPAAEPEPQADEEPTPAAAPEPVATASPPAKSARPSASSIAAETSLLARAQRELQSGDPEKALELLDEHGHEHKGGALREERRAARVLALCKAGRVGEGRTAAQRFVVEFPRSPQRARVLAACADGK